MVNLVRCLDLDGDHEGQSMHWIGEKQEEIGAGIKGSSVCISLHWTIESYQYPSYERPTLAEGDMCAGCRASMAAFFSRKIARQRLGISKRAILAVGKRINAGGAE